MMNRGKGAPDSSGSKNSGYLNPAGSSAGRRSRGPGVSSLNPAPKIGNNNSSVSGAGFKNNAAPSIGAKPYIGSSSGSGMGGLGDRSGSGVGNRAASLNTNVFNIPKYGQGGLGGGMGGIGGGIGSLGGGIGSMGGMGANLGSAGSNNK